MIKLHDAKTEDIGGHVSIRGKFESQSGKAFNYYALIVAYRQGGHFETQQNNFGSRFNTDHDANRVEVVSWANGHSFDQYHEQSITVAFERQRDAKERRDKLNSKLDKFLETYRESTSGGGWAPVTKEDKEQLNEVLYALLEAKFGRDADGDLPVQFNIVDRNKFEPNHFFNIPYSYDIADRKQEGLDQEEYEESRMSLMMSNLSIAMRGIDTEINIKRYNRQDKKEKSKEKA